MNHNGNIRMGCTHFIGRQCGFVPRRDHGANLSDP